MQLYTRETNASRSGYAALTQVRLTRARYRNLMSRPRVRLSPYPSLFRNWKIRFANQAGACVLFGADAIRIEAELVGERRIPSPHADISLAFRRIASPPTDVSFRRAYPRLRFQPRSASRPPTFIPQSDQGQPDLTRLLFSSGLSSTAQQSARRQLVRGLRWPGCQLADPELRAESRTTSAVAPRRVSGSQVAYHTRCCKPQPMSRRPVYVLLRGRERTAFSLPKAWARGVSAPF